MNEVVSVVNFARYALLRRCQRSIGLPGLLWVIQKHENRKAIDQDYGEGVPMVSNTFAPIFGVWALPYGVERYREEESCPVSVNHVFCFSLASVKNSLWYVVFILIYSCKKSMCKMPHRLTNIFTSTLPVDSRVLALTFPSPSILACLDSGM